MVRTLIVAWIILASMVGCGLVTRDRDKKPNDKAADNGIRIEDPKDPIPAAAWQVGGLKDYHVELKSVSRIDAQDYSLLLEIKDEAFRKSDFGTPMAMLFFFFDKDNVVLGKHPLSRVESEMTGKPGDAFQVSIRLRGIDPYQIRKIEVRPNVSGIGGPVKKEERK